MFTISRRTRTIAFGLLMTVAGVGMLHRPSSTRADAAASQAAPPELAKLQQEQIATLREACGIASKMFASGTGSVADADRLNHMLVEAELAAAASAQDRGRILQDALIAAKKQEDIASQQAKLGVATVLAPLEAKAYRLGIEMKLAEDGVK